MKILVTGATGFIGSHIVEELAKQGIPIRAGFRPGETFQEVDSDFLIDGLDLDSFPLDLNNRKGLRHQLRGVQILFHTEHFFSWKAKDKHLLYQINQIGTRNLMEAALANGVEKVVYTSGIETLGLPQGRELANERDGVAFEDLKTHFEKSRLLAEREVMAYRAKGLPTVIVHPTMPVGIRENQTTPFGQYLHRLLTGKSHVYLDTGVNLVDVHDVAKGHLLAAKRGRVGSRYILGNQNIYLLEVLEKISRITGHPPPKTAIPFGWAQLGNPLARLIFPKRSMFPNAIIRRLKRPQFFDNTLAKEELGFPQSNVWEALSHQIQYQTR